MRWAWLALALAACSAETGEARQALTVLDAGTEAAVETGPDVGTETGADAMPEASSDASPDAQIDSGADSPDTDSLIDAHEASVDVALDAVSEPETSPTCVPVYTETDSMTGAPDAGIGLLTITLECQPGESTPVSHWTGTCSLDGDFVDTDCNCSHVGTAGVKCSAAVKGTGTITLTIWCARDCDQ